jgi:hypothetical protein
MRRLGRLVALPLAIIALALQGLAPAQALAMPKDAFGLPICSAHDLGGARHQGPDRDRSHDCCAAACALAGLAAGPAQPPTIAPAAFGAPVVRLLARSIEAPARPPLRRPSARGPPPSVLTI